MRNMTAPTDGQTSQFKSNNTTNNGTEQLPNSSDDNWLTDTVSMLIEQGHRPIPMLQKGTPMPFGDAQKYPINDQAWGKAKTDIVSVALDDFILLDFDGNKKDKEVIPLEELLSIVGGEPLLVQQNIDGDSLHYLYKIPDHVDKESLKHSSDNWMPGIDVKTKNQLIHIKKGKLLIYDELPEKNKVPDAPQCIIDALTIVTPEFKANRLDSRTSDTKAREILDYIQPDCGYSIWIKIGMGLHYEFKGTDQGLALWDHWSMGADNYAGTSLINYKWQSFGKNTVNPTTFGTVCHMAKKAGADIAKINQKYDLTVIDEPNFPDVIHQKNGNTKPINTAENLNALINYKGYRCRFNMMTYSEELTFSNGSETNYTFDQIYSILISEASRYQLPKDTINDHFIAICQSNPYHPVREWLEQDKWDGIHRITEVVECINAKDVELAQIAIKKWLIGCIASLYEKKFSSKLIPVLQGGQSYRKTALVKRLGSVIDNTFLEGAELNPDNADSVLTCIYSWIVELGELERTSKNSLGSLKAFITKDEDRVRPPYFKRDIKKPRQTHFIATVNESDFLKDKTGNTRYAVIEMNKPADLDTINSILGWEYQNGKLALKNESLLRQFWLEVKSLYDAGESWMLKDSVIEQFDVINAAFQPKNKWYEHILNNHVNEAFCETVYQEQFFSAKEMVSNDPQMVMTDAPQVGMALTQLFRDDFAEMQVLRGNKKLYKLK